MTGSGPSRPGPIATARRVSRAGKWWGAKMGPLLAAAYLALLIEPAPIGDAAVRLVTLLVSASLLATHAYVVNDWCDRDADRAIGQPSATGEMARPRVAALVVALVVLGVAPWVVVGVPALAWAALAAIVALPYAYSAPPLRWKVRGWSGLVADAGMAHVAPTVFALAAFGGIGGAETAAEVVAVGATVAWSASAGLRKIIGHQIADEANDEAAGVVTWVRRVGAPRARRWVRGAVLPAELVSLTVVYAALWRIAPVAAVAGTALGGLFGVARLSGAWSEPLPALPSATDERAVLYLFYRVWPSLLLAAALVAREVAYVWLLAGHAVLFGPMVADEGIRAGRFVRDHPGAASVNWARFRMWPWLTHTVPNWFRHRVWVWLTHTIPNWFRYRWPVYRRAIRSRGRRAMDAVLHRPSLPGRSPRTGR